MTVSDPAPVGFPLHTLQEEHEWAALWSTYRDRVPSELQAPAVDAFVLSWLFVCWRTYCEAEEAQESATGARLERLRETSEASRRRARDLAARCLLATGDEGTFVIGPEGLDVELVGVFGGH